MTVRPHPLPQVGRSAPSPDLGLAAAFRDAMACLAAPVTIVTTVDVHDTPWGFTASAVCSLSLDPPLLLVSIARSSSCFETFRTAPRFVVNVLGAEHRELAARFAQHGADRFAAAEFRRADGTRLPYLPDATAVVHCATDDRLDGGDHLMLVGRVLTASARAGQPLVWHQRAFGTLG
ncbi:flavin oxidoreductase [Longispora fulva]|uniref:Flavin reductase ActVB n=1 Tax=Longispora fulva TaxID=619741 RepID=A0A8J7GBE9_9ACTN|nr:flavin reductase family protein [Longispora fulva]MBG6134351.1 flavin reductase ActVB [Longispora fulva]GIG63060.1 flavin oxidoreductase [Longispora fulva]